MGVPTTLTQMLLLFSLALSARAQSQTPAQSTPTQPAPAQGETIDLVETPDEKKHLPGLEWETHTPEVEIAVIDGANTPVVRLKGKLSSEKYQQSVKLFYQHTKPVRANLSGKEGAFEIVIPFQIRSGQIPVLLKAVDEFGISYNDVVYLRRRVEMSKNQKKITFDLGAGLSYLSYKETYRTSQFSINEIGLTVKAVVGYRLNRSFDVAANAFITAFPFVLSRSPSAIEPSRFLGINARVGYRLPIYSPSASYYVMTGWYIWGQMVPGPIDRNTYGVSMLGGPQVFLTARFTTLKNRNWFTYLKFATISNAEQGIFSTSNREIAVGGGYQLSNPVEKRRWMGTLDVASAAFSDTERNFTLLSISFGISTSF